MCEIVVGRFFFSFAISLAKKSERRQKLDLIGNLPEEIKRYACYIYLSNKHYFETKIFIENHKSIF